MTDPLKDLVPEIAARLSDLPKHDAGSLRRVRRDVSPLLEQSNGLEVIEIACDLVRTGAPGVYVVACELIMHHSKAPARVRASHVKRLGAEMSVWGHSDVLACYVAGRAWRAGQISDAEIARWARSPNRWWRRTALVCTVPLNVRAQGGAGDATKTLHVCRLLVDDRDDAVVKAMSWALRELAVRDPTAVREFVNGHEGSLARRIVREVNNKLRTGLKTGRRG